jgi:simple sugar transport system substrate-binding protein
LKERIVRNSPYGKAVSEKARKQADAARDAFMSGNFVIYKGPIKDNTGKTVIAAGQSHSQTDVWLESMNWLVEGVIGSTTG